MFRSALDALDVLAGLKNRDVSLHMIDLGRGGGEAERGPDPGAHRGREAGSEKPGLVPGRHRALWISARRGWGANPARGGAGGHQRGQGDEGPWRVSQGHCGGSPGQGPQDLPRGGELGAEGCLLKLIWTRGRCDHG